MTYTIVLVPPEKVRELWKKVRDHLEEAIKVSNGRWTSEYVLAALVLDEQKLWVAIDEDGEIDGVAVSQISRYPERVLLTIHYLSGTNFDDWYKQLLDTFARYAKDTGCSGIECIARFGFWKWFQNDGFKKTSAFYEKPI